MQQQIDQSLLDDVLELCRQAGREILKVYNQAEALEVTSKADSSPVTEADLAAHRVLCQGLEKMLDAVPVLSEEGDPVSYEQRRRWQRYWIIDPLDGTKEFISRNGEFTVNVALVEYGEPVLGVVYVPILDLAYLGLKSAGAWKQNSAGRQPIRTRKLGRETIAVVASRRHGAEAVERLLAKLEKAFGRVETRGMGSSLKLCLVAEGSADLYPRLAPTSEWDTAAAQAVVEAAGGRVITDTLEPMRYNTKENILNPFFYVVGDVEHDWKEILTT